MPTPRHTRKGFCPRKPRACHHTMLLEAVTTKNQLVCMNTALQCSSPWNDSDSFCRSFPAIFAMLKGSVMKAACPLTPCIEHLVLQSKALKLLRAAHLSKLKPEVKTTTIHPQLSHLLETELSKFPLSTYPASSC